jgi:hypothetical protein
MNKIHTQIRSLSMLSTKKEISCFFISKSFNQIFFEHDFELFETVGFWFGARVD